MSSTSVRADLDSLLMLVCGIAVFACIGTGCSLAYGAPTTSAPAQDVATLNNAIHTLFSIKFLRQTAISPDGQRIAWVEESLDKNGVHTGGTAIYVSDIERPLPQRITAGDSVRPCAEGSIAWAPDSRRLAFLSDAAHTGQQQLYVSKTDQSAPRRLTNLHGFLDSPGWSPDSNTLAALFTENATRATGPLEAETTQTGVIKEAVTEQRLVLIGLTSGVVRQISPPDMYIYEYDWSPDGTRFVTLAAAGNGDNNWYIAQLYLLSASGGEMKPIYISPQQTANPRWSPDGKSVAFISGLMSDEPSVGGDVFVIAVEGGQPKNLTPGMDATASTITWTKKNKILFGEWIDGGTGLARVDPVNGRIETLWKSEDRIRAKGWGAGVSIASDGQSSTVIRDSLSRPPEVWAGPVGEWKQITARNANLQPAWGEARSIHWQNEGFDLQGWLVYPRHFDPSKKYPMLVDVHGGPGVMASSAWPGPQSFPLALSDVGYFVFLPNPRGSFGQSEAFTRANVKDFGYGDWRDILAGVDAVLNQAPIDEHRLGLTGWSYGGFMTMWGVTQTNRFRAAVAGAGLSNWQSYYGQNQIDKWMIPFFGASVYDDPIAYARSSPITYIKNAQTPTLIVVGESDGECPTPQSYEFWHALKTLGVETELVVYEHEGHSFTSPRHQRDLIERAATWFDAHLK